MITNISNGSSTIITLDPSRKDEVTELLVRAFTDKPGFAYLIPVKGEKKRQKMHGVFSTVLDIHAATKQPILGVMVDDRVVGIAFIYEPGVQYSAWDIVRMLVRLTLEAGLPAAWRLWQLLITIEPHHPTEPYYYLWFLAVHPDFQGKGYGRRLLDAVCVLSETHPTSTGVWLETDTQQNVQMYEHFGYQVIKILDFNGFEMSLMFRANTK